METSPASVKNELAATIRIDVQLFSLLAVKKAAYRFTDRFFVAVDSVGSSEVTVQFSAKPGIRTDTVGALEEFRNELIDQDLRERVRNETEGVRRLLLAHALSLVPLVQPELETTDYDSDHSAES